VRRFINLVADSDDAALHDATDRDKIVAEAHAYLARGGLQVRGTGT
jgi:hypothetical protein